MEVFDQLILSDIHLYASRDVIKTNHDNLIECLDALYKKGYRFKHLILLGDIFEDWYVNASAEIKKNSYILTRFLNKLDDLLVNMYSTKIFVKGNHDSVSPFMRLDPAVHEFLVMYKYQIVERYEERGAVYVHGHQGSISKFQWFFQMLSCKIWYAVCAVFRSPALYEWAFSKVEKNASFRSADPEVRKTFYQDLIRRVKPGNNAIIFGHTHVPIIDEELKIVNTGDWMDNQTFVIRDENTFNLFSYVSKDNIVSLGELVLPL